MNQTQDTNRIKIAWRLERIPKSSYILFLGAIIIIAYFIEAIDNGAIGYFLPILKKEFNLTPAMLGYVGTISNVGVMCGAMVSGFLSDIIGRKKVLIASMAIFGVFGILFANAYTLNTVMIARVGIGIGMGGLIPVSATFLSEIVPAKLRAAYITAFMAFTPLGYLGAGLMSYYMIPIPSLGWRGVALIQALLSIFVVMIIKYVPESPLWLESKGRFEEADAIMTNIEKKVAKGLGRELPEVVIPADGYKPVVKHPKAALSELFSSKYIRSTIMVTIWWACAVGAAVGLSTWFSTLMVARGFTIQKSIGYVALMYGGGVLGIWVVRFLVKRIGRKWTTVTCALLAMTMAYCYGSSTVLPAILFFGVLYNVCAYSSSMINTLYGTELFNNRIRGTALGYAYTCARLGAIFGPIIIGMIMTSYGVSQVFLFAGGLYLVAAIAVALLGKETGEEMFSD